MGLGGGGLWGLRRVGPGEPFDVLGDDVDLEVDRRADTTLPSVVSRSVVGMSPTEKPASSTSVTVRLTPSTAIEPFSTT